MTPNLIFSRGLGIVRIQVRILMLHTVRILFKVVLLRHRRGITTERSSWTLVLLVLVTGVLFLVIITIFHLVSRLLTIGLVQLIR